MWCGRPGGMPLPGCIPWGGAPCGGHLRSSVRSVTHGSPCLVAGTHMQCLTLPFGGGSVAYPGGGGPMGGIPGGGRGIPGQPGGGRGPCIGGLMPGCMCMPTSTTQTIGLVLRGCTRAGHCMQRSLLWAGPFLAVRMVSGAKRSWLHAHGKQVSRLQPGWHSTARHLA